MPLVFIMIGLAWLLLLELGMGPYLSCAIAVVSVVVSVVALFACIHWLEMWGRKQGNE